MRQRLRADARRISVRDDRVDAYLDSQAEAVEMALSASVVGGPLKSMLDMRDICAGKIKPGEAQYPGPQGFRGTAAQLLAELICFLSMQGKGRPGIGRRRRAG